jgi:hypothetical protein
VWIVTVETCVGCQLATSGQQVLANVNLGEIGWPRLEAPVAQLAQLTAAAHRHLGQYLALFEVHVEVHRAVAQLALNGGVDPGGVIGVLDVVTHRAGLVAAVANRLVTVFSYCCAPVPTVFAPRVGDEKGPAEDHRDEHNQEQNRCSKDVFSVQERALRIHLPEPPWWAEGVRDVGLDPT